MKMKIWIRKIHLYLGCVFAPLLLVFLLSGMLQVFAFHRIPKTGDFVPPRAITTLASYHTVATAPPGTLGLYKWFIALMAIGLLITTILGIIMAFQVTRRRRTVIACLATGIVIPVLFWYLGRAV